MANSEWNHPDSLFAIRYSPASFATRHSLRFRARRGGRRRLFARIEPGRIGPAVLVVVGHAVLGQPDHAVERARGARVPHRLDADVLVVAGVVALVELVAGTELGADRVPQELHDLDALLVADAVRAAHVAGEVLVDLGVLEILCR